MTHRDAFRSSAARAAARCRNANVRQFSVDVPLVELRCDASDRRDTRLTNFVEYGCEYPRMFQGFSAIPLGQHLAVATEFGATFLGSRQCCLGSLGDAPCLIFGNRCEDLNR